MTTLNAKYLYDNYGGSTYNLSAAGSVTIQTEGSMFSGLCYSVQPTSDASFTLSAGQTKTVSIYLFSEGRPQTSATRTVTIAAPAPVAVCTVTTSSSPSGAGILSGAGEYTLGQTIYLTADSASSAYVFDHWSAFGNTYPGSAVDVTVTSGMLGNTYSCTAYFTSATTYTISTASSPSGGGSTSGGGTFYSGDSVTLVATPNSGYVFDYWMKGGSIVSYSRSFSFTAGSSTGQSGTFTAHFSLQTYTCYLYYSANGGSGAPSTQSYTSSSTSSHTFTISSTVPTRSSYAFLGWSTSPTATSASYQPGGTISVGYNSSVYLYAVWVEAVSAGVKVGDGSGSATVTYGSQSATSSSSTVQSITVPKNSTVTVTATPAANNIFDHWTYGPTAASLTTETLYAAGDTTYTFHDAATVSITTQYTNPLNTDGNGQWYQVYLDGDVVSSANSFNFTVDNTISNSSRVLSIQKKQGNANYGSPITVNFNYENLTTSTITPTLAESTTFTANFKEVYDITIGTDPNQDGWGRIVTSAPLSLQVSSGSIIHIGDGSDRNDLTISVSSANTSYWYSARYSTQTDVYTYEFDGWYINGTKHPDDDYIFVSSDLAIVAKFTRSYRNYRASVVYNGDATQTINGNTVPSTGGTLTDLHYNDTVTLTAVPDAGYRFIKWHETYTDTDFDINNVTVDTSTNTYTLTCTVISNLRFTLVTEVIGPRVKTASDDENMGIASPEDIGTVPSGSTFNLETDSIVWVDRTGSETFTAPTNENLAAYDLYNGSSTTITYTTAKAIQITDYDDVDDPIILSAYPPTTTNRLVVSAYNPEVQVKIRPFNVEDMEYPDPEDWPEKTITFSYTPDPVAGEIPTAVATPLPGDKYATYEFDGWYNSDDEELQTGDAIQGTALYTETITAKFTRTDLDIPIKLNYNANATQYLNGTAVTQSVESFYTKLGQTVTLTAVLATGYRLHAWEWEDSDHELSGSYTSSTPGVTIVGQTVTLTREVQGIETFTLIAISGGQTFTVTFNPQGGQFLSGSNTKSVVYGLPYGVLPTVHKNGYIFDPRNDPDTGWFTSPTGGTRVTSDTTVNLTADQTLYAHYTYNDAPSGDSVAWIARYSGEGSEIMDIPNIQSIEEVDSANLTEISTIVCGYDQNFVMDLGTTQKFTVTFKRVQPRVVIDDNDYSRHQHVWSNGHWFKMFKRFTDIWQNLTKNQDDVRTGGFTFHFEPTTEPSRPSVDYTDLYPAFTRNVFIAGAITAQFSNNLQYMTVSLPLATGSMIRTKTQTVANAHQVTYTSGNSGIATPQESTVYKYPDGMAFMVAYPPEDWIARATTKRFVEWRLPGGTGYAPGEVVTGTTSVINNIATLNSYWISADENNIFELDDVGTLNIYLSGSVPSEDTTGVAVSGAKYIKVYAVAGGGKGGDGFAQGINQNLWWTGGGGGSGG